MVYMADKSSLNYIVHTLIVLLRSAESKVELRNSVSETCSVSIMRDDVFSETLVFNSRMTWLSFGEDFGMGI